MSKRLFSHSPTLILLFWSVALSCASCLITAACWEPGRHPGFKGRPKVKQVTIDRVKISWAGKIDRVTCVDNFVVKYWQRLDAREFKVSPLIENHRRFVILEVVPYVIYHYQVVAREEISFGRVTYNRSPVVTFQTSRDGGGPAFSKQYFARYDNGDFSSDYFEESKSAARNIFDEVPAAHGESPVVVLGMAIEVFVVVAVIMSIAVLIVIGVVYKMASAYCFPLVCSGEDDEDDDEDDDDDEEEDGDEDEEDLEDGKSDVEKQLSVVGEEEEEKGEEEQSSQTNLQV